MKNTLLIAVSGWGQDEERQKSTSAGFDHHLVKPVDFDALTKLFVDVPLATGRRYARMTCFHPCPDGFDPQFDTDLSALLINLAHQMRQMLRDAATLRNRQ